jgi:phosphoglycerate dehydrogenase-like enzyme
VSSFRVVFSPDFPRLTDGTLRFAEGFEELFAAAGVVAEMIPGPAVPELRPDQLRDADALLLYAARLTAASLEGADRLKLVARAGAGLDAVDLEACAARGITVTNTPDGVRRPMASAALLAILALSFRLLPKDRITRAGEWERADELVGGGLTGETLGLIGAGNIGGELLRLAAPFEMRPLVYDPYLDADACARLGAEPVALDELLRRSRFVCVLAPLTPETFHLLDATRLGLMRKDAYLVNIARGPIVEEAALIAALEAEGLAGALLDVFEAEPLPRDSRLTEFDNVILTPHSLCVSSESYRMTNESATESVLAVARGEVPRHVVTPLP